ncbi:MFS transporter [Altericroceibacterium spongiae]|uniref:MFS transporter n=1 Tax=Altericroceibacterium spongiae TaxID=2320269 RepID=A0A420EQ07_9SPHN|nr:MFS transporter [Altericroceibacterium spongiae]
MDLPLLLLCAACATFVGSHFLLSHPLRAPLVALLGERLFLLVYSLIALAAMGWMAFAFRAAGSPDLPGSGETGWVVASLLSIVALVMVLGSFRHNPALPNPASALQIPIRVRSVFRVTRHPMMWGFVLWAASHLILFWSWRTMIVALAILILALVGAHLQDRKKEHLFGVAWRSWERRTCFWPRWRALFTLSPFLWLFAIILWLGLTWLHIPAAGIPAGLWRWIG